jgi:Domain of unknown function (DUF5130)
VIAGELSTDVAVPSSQAEAATHPPVAPPTKAHPSWHPEVLDGPLSTRALLRVDEALRLADAATGLTFSVYIGELGEAPRDTAEHLLGQLSEPDTGVLIAVSPNERQLEIVTGSIARRRILDRDAKLAALSMSAAFAGGDLGGGIVAGLAQLAEHAGRR